MKGGEGGINTLIHQNVLKGGETTETHEMYSNLMFYRVTPPIIHYKGGGIYTDQYI